MTRDVSSQSESNGYSRNGVASQEESSSSPDELESRSSSLQDAGAEDEGRSPQSWFSGKVGLAIGLAAGLALGMGVLGRRPAPPSEPATEDVATESIAPAQSVTVASVEARQVSRTLEATGTVTAFDLLPILPRATGLQIQQVLVDEGDSVTAGQVMAVLDRSVLEAQISESRAELEAERAQVQQQQAVLVQAQARLAEARTNLQRFESLSSEGAVSTQDYDTRATAAATAQEDVRVAEANVNSARADVRSQEARVQQLQTQLEQTLVKAPANGLVAERMARVGNVTNSTTLFTIIRDRLLELQVNIPETQLPDIRVGTPVTITSDADERIQLQGRVREISPLINSDTREAIVTIDLPPSNLLRPGMFLRVSIVTSSSDGLTIPAEAVIPQSGGDARVYRVVEGDRTEAVTVTLGELLDSSDPTRSRIEILSGLNRGDRVVVDGAGYLNDGDRITIVSN
ncbi:MAG: efflux RND transporter periplasmic adaptor subunit [Leptolyngbyaceae bacterium]|nr:efflux RND transporter periplasmic adaptor subunit [Leptolyngbyaceae bacterium]